MQIDEFTHRFFQMEMDKDLFLNRTPSSDPAWDVVRFEVFISLFDVISEPGHANSSGIMSAQKRPLGFPELKTIFTKLRTLAQQLARLRRVGKADFVAFICSRYKDTNGEEIDFASHNAVKTLSTLGSLRRIESEVGIVRDINVNALRSVARRIYPTPVAYRRYFRQLSSIIEEAQHAHFGTSDPHLLEIVSQSLINYLADRFVWAEILDRSVPTLLLMTQNGIQKGLILEARKRNIPVVECQHGVINLMHAAYSYPPTRNAREATLLPDALLLFSDYWKKQCRMPATELIVVGNDCFVTRGSRSTRTGAAVFVSAGILHQYLSPLAIEIARQMPQRDFIMKLHPSQASDRSTIEREYQHIPNLSVVCMEKSLPALLADSSDVVVVQSTASYEALDAGVPVHIFKKGAYMSHKDLFSCANVHVFSSADELRDQLFIPLQKESKETRFFQEFNAEAFRSAILEFSSRRSRNLGVLERALYPATDSGQ